MVGREPVRLFALMICCIGPSASRVLLTLGGFCLPPMLDKDDSGILLEKVNVNMYN